MFVTATEKLVTDGFPEPVQAVNIFATSFPKIRIRTGPSSTSRCPQWSILSRLSTNLQALRPSPACYKYSPCYITLITITKPGSRYGQWSSSSNEHPPSQPHFPVTSSALNHSNLLRALLPNTFTQSDTSNVTPIQHSTKITVHTRHEQIKQPGPNTCKQNATVLNLETLF